MDVYAVLKLSLILFAIIDVVGTLPMALTIYQREGFLSPLKSTIVAGVLMFFFFFTGEWLLRVFGLSIHSFALAGSIVVLASALELIFDKALFNHEQTPKGLSAYIPIAFPMLAGAGTISTIITLRNENYYFELALAILLNLIVIFISLKAIVLLNKRIPPFGFILLRKFFGIFILAIGIQMFYTHISHLF